MSGYSLDQRLSLKRNVLGLRVQQQSIIVESSFMETSDRCNTNMRYSHHSPINDENSLIEMQNQSFESLRRQDPTLFYKTPGTVKFVRRRTSFDSDEDYFAKYRVPDHVLLLIFSHLNKKDLVSVVRTCKRFLNIAYNNKSFWSFLNLENKHISEHSLHSLLDRKIEILRLTGATLQSSDSIPPFIGNFIRPSSLTHLDLSHAKFDNLDALVYFLGRCSSLECLSLEACYVNDSACIEIAKNSKLQCLNMIMASGWETRGLIAIMNQCKQLAELNLGWANLTPEMIRNFVRTAPITLQRLNLSGTRTNADMNDESVRLLCQRCPNLMELDLSDNNLITSKSIPYFRAMPCLRKLDLARCYGIEPRDYLTLNTSRLEELNIHNCTSDEGVEFLREFLHPTLINESIFSIVARPTVGEAATSIWGMRTRDIY
uniref:F-box domain-containing protein n=1 Tax=Acrobeloides nanus TaxID=290746 RepID=A0A914C0X0_9BILA